ncbi:SsgA family sporulation/cell division regulator [Streptomyces shenzhenensis]|uniref:SsgA family sporulation/cell division regulator n=1 Tax=Streptomyces shenzhenensis TaxID=943815 RepID=A0A3M0HWH0_9ACTN|nr:SsgA family sporulation/cell division regulator [Streptomyces shenzhenensis]RMB80052.1 SsgA family sporulation/cell division regulator [Streptomyces shenzhenensis]
MKPRVHKSLVVQLQAGGTGRFTVLAHLTYDAGDPFAVTAVFGHDGHVLARWRLDREMLAEGLRGPVGIGDVRLRPVATGMWQELRIDLLGDVRPDGGRHHAVVYAWAPAVAAFLRESREAVPPGREEVPVDDVLAEILAAG